MLFCGDEIKRSRRNEVIQLPKIYPRKRDTRSSAVFANCDCRCRCEHAGLLLSSYI